MLDVIIKRFEKPGEAGVALVGARRPGVGATRCTLFNVPPEPHDSWVVGQEPYVSLHFLGADQYARTREPAS
jgi:hypothetical protein